MDVVKDIYDNVGGLVEEFQRGLVASGSQPCSAYEPAFALLNMLWLF